MAELETRSKEILSSLTEGLDFTIPNIDFNDKAFEIPQALIDALQKVPEPLTTALLTERVVDGNGTFDAIMTAMKEHLKIEYNEGRITGAEYTKAYIAMLQSALQFAVQYLLGRDNAYFQAIGAQTQALTNSINIYKAKVELAIAQAQAHQNKAEYANKVCSLGSIDKQVTLVESQTGKVNEETKLVGAQTLVQTQQEKLLVEQTEAAHSQTSDTKLDNSPVSGSIGKQAALIQAQTEVQKQQKELLVEQTEQAHAQVSDTQLDGTTPVTGYTGNQNSLLKQQVTSFKKDAIIKAAKVYADSLTTQLSMNTATVAGTGLDAAGIGKAIGKLASSMDSQ